VRCNSSVAGSGRCAVAREQSPVYRCHGSGRHQVRSHNAGKSGKKYLPETLGSGAAFFDADGDGWIDVLLVNGKDWTPRGRHTTAALYRNNHDGTFTDITRGSGLDVEMYGIGVAVADLTMTVARTSTSPLSKATAFFITKATASSKT
jgi:hypothetical protein